MVTHVFCMLATFLVALIKCLARNNEERRCSVLLHRWKQNIVHRSREVQWQEHETVDHKIRKQRDQCSACYLYCSFHSIWGSSLWDGFRVWLSPHLYLPGKTLTYMCRDISYRSAVLNLWVTKDHWKIHICTS